MNDSRFLESDDEGRSAPPPPAMPGDIWAFAADDALFAHNLEQIDQMNVAAGSMVKGLIMELERGSRDTFIRLRDPDVGGHGVSYDFMKGDPGLVGRIGRALGFALVTDHRLEVRHG